MKNLRLDQQHKSRIDIIPPVLLPPKPDFRPLEDTKGTPSQKPLPSSPSGMPEATAFMSNNRNPAFLSDLNGSPGVGGMVIFIDISAPTERDPPLQGFPKEMSFVKILISEIDLR
ncbi:hypothetical protein [Rubellicoccus peritrichatus]|uniref:Uncharacterized protein n=1 Tax=Rubellicoccus peritrichatus TaxID=3080537 RepID=A0AAQ3L783_9BACT|nr:hypothetical protein [Puniceicoccus sp. CR14]WOO40311.1 hypothetical protein RZN69_16955 [Puniceicoccus sp. CR14]